MSPRIDDDPAVTRAREAARARAVRDMRGMLDQLAADLTRAAQTDTTTGAGAAHLAGQLDRIRRTAEQLTTDAVDLARAEPDQATWDEIGEHLGMDRRNAHRKYGKGKSA